MHEVALVGEAFEVDILVFVQAADAGDEVEGAVDRVIVGQLA